MKRYIGTKIVDAKPMSRADYYKHRGWGPLPDESSADEGFLVEYLDGGPANHPAHAGYISWSPRAVFERAYRDVNDMTFGQAIEALKDGRKVARKEWNRKGLYLELQVPNEYSKTTYIYMQYPSEKVKDTGPWLVSQTDMLAEDWMIV